MTLDIIANYRVWRSQNPHAIRVITHRALAKQAAGRGRGSAWENADLRFDQAFRIETQDEFKISNDYWSLMARDIVRSYPILEMFFELRPLKNFEEYQVNALLSCSPEAFPIVTEVQGTLFPE